MRGKGSQAASHAAISLPYVRVRRRVDRGPPPDNATLQLRLHLGRATIALYDGDVNMAASRGVLLSASPGPNAPMVFTSTSGGPTSAAIRSMSLAATAGSVLSAGLGGRACRGHRARPGSERPARGPDRSVVGEVRGGEASTCFKR